MEQASADSVKRDDSLKIRRIGLFSEKTAPDWFSELGRTEVITRQDIESCPVQTLEGVLSRVPGISIRRYGPMGSLGQVNVRGGEGNTVARYSVDYPNILYTFLQCERRATLASQKLCMHRNTVLYHVGKIEEMLGITLDDPDTRLQLLLGFKMLELKPAAE